MQGRTLQAAVLGLEALLVLGATSAQPDVIRTHGLVIVDDQGRERIVMGTPIPRVGGRRAELATMREALVSRLSEIGIDGIIRQRRAASILHAWSQSGLRDEAVAAV